MRIPGIGSFPAVVGDKVPGVTEEQQDVIRQVLQQLSHPPTRQEYQIIARHALEAWPDSLHALSVPSIGFELTEQERDHLANWYGTGVFPDVDVHTAWSNAEETFRHAYGDDQILPVVVAKCDAHIAKFSEPPFFKLGTRSPKNSPFFPISKGRVENGYQVILLMMTSARMMEDLACTQIHSQIARKRKDALAVDRLPWMWFRQYAPIPRYAEFRCFMKDRQFVGATQYHGVEGRIEPLEVFPELVERGYEYEAAIKAFFPVFRDACEFNSCVFDVHVDLDSGKITLIETNPALPTTFPGLKRWNDPKSFDGELRWLDGELPPQIVISAEDLWREMTRRKKDK